MHPITRKEMYLNRLAGEQEQTIPTEPVTREEQYLGRLCGENNIIPEEPKTRREQYLAVLCGEDVIVPANPETRIEQYMAFASGESESKPEKPITREEMYWDKYQGGDVPEEKTIAFTDIITVTDALARPAVDLQSEITATQNLNGYEYPWVGGAGKNKLNHGTIDVTPNTIVTTTLATMFLESGTYTLSYTLDTTVTATRNRPTCIIGSETIYGNDIKTAGRGSWTFTLEEDTTVTLNWWYHTVSTACTISDFQLELGSTATAYVPYENICPISGRTEVNVTRTGANVWDEVWENGYYDRATGAKAGNSNTTYFRSKNYIPCIPSTSYYFVKPSQHASNNSWYAVLFYDANKNFISATNYVALNPTQTAPDNAHYMTIYVEVGTSGATYNHDISINYPSTATAYEPYDGDTFNTELGLTVYGGVLDLTTGELTITHEYARIGDLTIDPYTWGMENEHTVVFAITQSTWGRDYKFKCDSYAVTIKNRNDLENGEMTGEAARLYFRNDNFTTKQEFQTALADVNIVFKLLVPRKYTLTPTEVQMLLGNNTIWADSGRVQLTYLSKAAEKVQLMNASLKANTLKLTKGAIKE